ncbi:filamentous hemagglutinin N-terminal domain-containing protein [Nostoc sp. CENA543]|uniref:two-partner secretion domain-containing protein n=1 Tax=Nostoc sp. CENA543 TaxID=1869241 RepID=UPI0012FFD61C|nr:filamentous hemagglutinin N-terminal domain-containing protein [Nostoc sp. CENA543]
MTTSVILNHSQTAVAEIIEDKTLPDNSQVTLSRRTFLIEGGTQIGNNLFHSFSEFSLPENYIAYFNNHTDIQNIFSRVTGNKASYINGLIQVNPGANLFLINPNGISFGAKAQLRIGGSFFASTANSINFNNGEKFSTKPEESSPLLTVKTPIGLQIGIDKEKPLTKVETLETPIGLEFASKPGNIIVQGESLLDRANLQVPFDQTLALVGGDIFLENADLSISRFGGRIELGSVASAGFVGLTSTKLGTILNFDQAPDLGNIQISSATNINSLGALQVVGRNILINGSTLKAQTDINLQATENIQLSHNSSIHSQVSGRNSGDFNINTQNLLIQDGSYLGIDKGNLNINASDTVQLNSNPDTTVQGSSLLFATASGDINQQVGNITINTRHLVVDNGSQILTNSSGSAAPSLLSYDQAIATVERSNIAINATESVTLSGSSLNELNPSGLFTRTFEGGDSGTITVNTKVLSITDGAQIATNNFSDSQAGNLRINATDKLEIIGTSRTGKIFADFLGGEILVDDPAPDASLISLSSAQGLRIQGTLPSGVFTNAPSAGDAGNIDIKTRILVTQDGGQISSNNFNRGHGGDVTINASEQVQLLGTSPNGISSGLFTRANPRTTGDAGTLNLFTGNLLVKDGAQVSASTFGAGTGGVLNVEVTDGIKLIGVSRLNVPSGLFTQANAGSTADAGELTINTSTLLVQNGAQISASTFGTGNGGNLTVKATAGIELIGTSKNENLFPSGLFAITARRATGDAGNLTDETFASTYSKGDTTGDAGNLIVDTPKLLVRDGAQIAASTSSEGKAGNVTVNVPDRVQIIGTAVNGAFPSGLFVSGTPESSGNAGNLIIKTNVLEVFHGAGIAVRNRGSGSAGNLFVNTRSMELNNQAFISADTRGVSNNPSQLQANINLSSQDLILLRGRSSITTNATGNNVIGGNINIDTKLLAAFENSDISANSADFRGGRVKVSAQGIIGTQYRTSLTPESDITATGATPDLSGTVEINTPEVDPSRGLTELPSNLVDVSNQIAQKCHASENRARQRNQFLITGKGGIPTNPYDTLQNESAIANWINVDNINNTAQNHTNYTKITSPPETPIIEAQALVSDSNGNLILTANTPNLTSQKSALTHPVCNS